MTTAASNAVPGWKFVPIEASWEMTRPAFSFDVYHVKCDCGQEHHGGLSHNKAAELYAAMTAAAPTPIPAKEHWEQMTGRQPAPKEPQP